MDNIDLDLLKMLIASLEDTDKIAENLTIKDIAYSTIVAMGEDTVKPLTEYLKNEKGIHNRDKNQEVANILLDICMVYGNNVPLDVFMDAARGMSEFRLEAIRAIGYIGDKEAYKLIIKILKDPKEMPIYKANAVSSFGDLYFKHGKKEDLKLLFDVMKSLPKIDEVDEITGEDIITLKNNIIAATNKVVNIESGITIGEFIKRRKTEL